MSKIFTKLRILLSNTFQFQYHHIQPQTKFELELGMDSREMIELLNECEQTFQIQINWDDIDLIIN
jgi:acyl carrier protein